MDVSEVGRPDTLIELRALRFCFEARQTIHFPAGQSANILRGAFGSIFRKLACDSGCRSAATCEMRAACPYAQMFEPTGPAPSGLTDWPRPFVFRAGHLDGLTFEAGGVFHFDLNLFDLRGDAEKYLELAFAQLAREGLGASRSKVQLLRVESQSVAVPLNGAGNQTQAVVRFLTPTELKSNSQIALTPEFSILMARLRDRIGALNHFYGTGALDIDYKLFAERAALVEMTRCEIQQVSTIRRSSRTGQSHSIGGFVGEAEYRGQLQEFIPWLKAAYWTGVGRQTVWGKGMLELQHLPASEE